MFYILDFRLEGTVLSKNILMLTLAYGFVENEEI